MKKEKRLLLLSILAVLMLALAAWRLWPRSFRSLCPPQLSGGAQLGGTAVVLHLENGQPSFESWALSQVSSQEAPYSQILSLLDGAVYRPSFRGLLPWSAELSPGREPGTRVTLLFVWGSGEEDSCSLTLDGGGLLLGRAGRPDRLYFPSSGSLPEDLLACFEAYGQQG